MAEKTTEIVIPKIQLRRTVVPIVGQTPLLTNRFSEKAQDAIEKKQQKAAAGPKDARDPQADFLAALHVIEPGVYGFQSSGIKKALVAAGGRFADEKMTRLRGAISLPAPLVRIDAAAPRMRSDPVRLRTGAFTIAYRPEFWPWSMQLEIIFNSAVISEAQVYNLTQIAGFSIGIGAWRPENGGSFGQFALGEGAVQEAA